MKKGDQRREGEGDYTFNNHDYQKAYNYGGVLEQKLPQEYAKPHPKPMGRQGIKNELHPLKKTL